MVAGMLLAPESGKKLRKDIKQTSAHFYHSIVPQIKKLKRVGDAEYKSLVEKALHAYSKAKDLAPADIQELKKTAESHWKEIKKHLK